MKQASGRLPSCFDSDPNGYERSPRQHRIAPAAARLLDDLTIGFTCTDRIDLVQLAAELRPSDCLALEVTTNSFAVARLLGASQASITLSDPIKTRRITEAKVSTDKIDARVLAELLRADYLPAVWAPDPDTQQLRQLMSDRQSLVDRRTELKNRIHLAGRT